MYITRICEGSLGVWIFLEGLKTIPKGHYMSWLSFISTDTLESTNESSLCEDEFKLSM